jgi:hypothetical protein
MNELDKIAKKADELHCLFDSIDEEWRHEQPDEDWILHKLLGGISEFGIHPRLISRLADLIQLANRDTIRSRFSLEEAERLHNANLRVDPTDLSSYVELANYYDAVTDERTKAIQLAHSGLFEAKRFTNDLSNVIDND